MSRLLSPAPPLRLLTHQRLFSTTPHLQKLSPESPHYISIPRPPRTPLWKPRVKGLLPQPKTIFPSVGPDKTSDEYFSLVTPEPTKPKRYPANKPTDSAYITWKANMATKRRENLREGLKELAFKKKTFDEKRERILKKRMEERQALLDRKEREDVRLTLPSVLSTVKNPEPFSDPNRHDRLESKAQQLQAREAAKAEARADHLHTLYLHASSFILTEAQLDKEIQAEFTESMIGKTFPLTVSEMLAQRAKGPPLSIFGVSPLLTSKETELILEAAATLTGGKLSKESFQNQEEEHPHSFQV